MLHYTKPQNTSLWIAIGVAALCSSLILGFIVTGVAGKATLMQQNAESFAHMLQESNSGSVINPDDDRMYAAPTLKGLPPSFGMESAF
ncbi:MAG: hypothetical protein ACK4NC_02315 [Candidatus Gracilibacteria bacterium]